MTLDPRRLQRHLRLEHRANAQAVRVGGFTCYLHPGYAHEALNVAVPDEPQDGRRLLVEGADAAEIEPPVALAAIRAYFRGKARTPRIEFLAECHPELPELLAREGWRRDVSVPVLACTPDSWRRVDPPEGVRIEPLLPDTPWPTARAYLLVQREAYGLDIPVPERAPAKHWEALHVGAGILATREGAPVGAGGLTPLVDGLCDVRGLGVVPTERRRGVGAFLLSALARVGHDIGAEAVVAIPDGEETVRLGARAGFERAATLVSFKAAAAVGP